MADVPSDLDATIRVMLASGGEALVEVAEAPPPAEFEQLEAEELRLLAAGIGDHLPVELAERVEELRRRRRAGAGMRLAGVEVGDVVLVSKGGRHIYGEVVEVRQGSSTSGRCAVA
jgi:hypothetical protein